MTLSEAGPERGLPLLVKPVEHGKLPESRWLLLMPGTTLLIARSVLPLVKYVPRVTWKGITTCDITILCTDK